MRLAPIDAPSRWLGRLLRVACVEEANLHENVSDEVFEELRKHYRKREIVEITVMNAVENSYELLNMPPQIPDDGLLAAAQARARA